MNYLEMRTMKIYWMRIDLVFKKKLKITHQSDKSSKFAKGLIMAFGITEENEAEAKKNIKKLLATDSDIKEIPHNLKFDDIGVIEPEELEKEIYGDPEIKDSLKQSPLKTGIWYASGKGYYC